jgi:hypothetical protein
LEKQFATFFLALVLLLAGLPACKPTQTNLPHTPDTDHQVETSTMAPATEFQDAFLLMNWDAALKLAGSNTEQRILAFAQSTLHGSAQLPLSLRQFPGTKSDSLLLAQWNTLSQSYCWLKDDYAGAATGPDPTTAAFAKSFTMIPEPEQIVYNRDQFEVPLYRSGSNSPIVDVKINGKSYRFWLDSGAGVSVVSSAVAKKTGVRSLTGGDLNLHTSTRHMVRAGPSFIDSLVIGDLKVTNHPCVILDKRDLSFRILGIRLLKIDGIIGWPLIKKLDLEIDLPGEQLTIRKPIPQPTLAGNLAWFWQPFMQCRTTNGSLLNLQIDTGSESTFFYPTAYPKLSQNPTQGGKSLRGGAGGNEIITYDRLDSCVFAVGDSMVTLNFAEGIAPSPSPDDLFVFDGVIGQNILSKGKFRMDFVNRRFGFEMGGE